MAANKRSKWMVLLGCLAGLVVIGTALPFVKGPFWYVRVFDFPRAQLAVLGLVLLAVYGVLLVRTRSRWDVAFAVLVGLAVTYQGWRMWPYTSLHPVESVNAKERSPERSVRLIVANVLMDNREAPAMFDNLLAAEPDVVLLVEPDAWWIEQAEPLRRELPHAVEHPLDNRYGIALYSRFELEDVAVRALVEPDVPSLWGAFRLRSGERVRFAFIHPAPPHVAEDSDDRDAELVLVAREVEPYDEPTIVAGDFNDVAWSRTTTLFQELSGLLDPRVGRELLPSYHADYFILRWPIDHLFHSEHFAVAELTRLEPGGSDHFPILVELSLEAAALAEQDPPDAEPEDQEDGDEILRDAGV